MRGKVGVRRNTLDNLRRRKGKDGLWERWEVEAVCVAGQRWVRH